jgi:transcriptional regulator with PAS, ATPase and Fis domain
MSNAGRFRSDLYFRLNVISLAIPPLREREGDAVKLAQYFMQQTEHRYGLNPHTLSISAIEAIQAYRWPGNVSELKHQISRAVLLSNQPTISAVDIGLPVNHANVTTQQTPELMPQPTLDAAEKRMLFLALEAAQNNVSKAARQLGITRMKMRYRMAKHRINI